MKGKETEGRAGEAPGARGLVAVSTAAASGASARGDGRLIDRTFRSYLALSVLITLSATLGMMIDNVIAGNLLGPDAVAAVGMSLPVFMLFSAAAGILETGAVAQAARALGSRDTERVNALFSVTVSVALVAGAALSAGTVLCADGIARVLGATGGALLDNTRAYLSGLGCGAFAVVLLQVMMGFARLDNAPQLGLAAIVVMSACDVCLNLAAVLALGLGLFGMGLATALSYVVALCVCSSHLLSKRNTLRFRNPFAHPGCLGAILKTGVPDSLTRLCVMARTFLFNHLLLIVAGAAAVTALSLLSSVNSFMSSIAIGVGQTATLLCGVFFGEQDRTALKWTLRAGLRTGLGLCTTLTLAAFALAEQVVRLFGVTPGGEAFAFGVVAVRAFCLAVPIDLVSSLFVSYYQGTGNVKAANLVTVGQTFLFSALFALCTVWFWGAYGVWLSFAAGEAIVLAAQVAAASVLWKRRRAKRSPAGSCAAAGSGAASTNGAASTSAAAVPGRASLLDKMMYLPADFQADWAASFERSFGADMDAAVACSRDMEAWCRELGVDGRRTYVLALAVEEMAGNIVRHGLAKVKTPAVDVKAILRTDGRITLRLRDNGRRFNPLDYDQREADDFSCIGIRLVRRSIDDIDYQNAVGINNLIITV